jgi:hemolysin III
MGNIESATMNLQIPPDNGGLYTETNLQNLFPEPLNAITSLFFLVLAIGWTIKIGKRWRHFPFLSYALVLLYIGGIGGSIYHGFRLWRVFLIMDWLPIMLLCLSAGLWFLAKLTKWYYAALLVVGYFIFQQLLRIRLEGDIQLFININYAVMAAIVVVPVFAFLISTLFKHAGWVLMALIAFVVALFFRISDKWGLLTVGTHFLWHTFGAVAAFGMLRYVYLVETQGEAEQGEAKGKVTR